MAQRDEGDAHQKTEAADDRKSRQSGNVGILDTLRIIVGLFLLSLLASYMFTGTYTWNQNPWWLRPKALAARLRSPIVLTEIQLSAYAGQDESLPIYLALNGTIYDVTAGRRIYGPGGPYNHFAGRDATRAYITGCFQEDSVPDTRGVEWMFVPVDVPHFTKTPDEELSEEMRGYRYEEVGKAFKEVDKAVEHWAKVFRGETGKEYWQVGRVKSDHVGNKLPIRELCKIGERKRPKARFVEGKEYGQGGERARRAQKMYEELKGKSAGHDEM